MRSSTLRLSRPVTCSTRSNRFSKAWKRSWFCSRRPAISTRAGTKGGAEQTGAPHRGEDATR
eukprot:4889822-Alexandrium_andersonii.AAC.1